MMIRLGVLCFVVLLVSCDPNRVYEKNYSFKDDTWHVYDTKKFNFEIKDSTQLYNLFVNIRNTTSYRYSNLYIFMNTTFPDNQMARDTIEIIVADPQGRWLGRGWGNYRVLKAPLGLNLQFGLTGKYTFEFEHAMRTQKLKHISDIGMRIEKTSNE